MRTRRTARSPETESVGPAPGRSLAGGPPTPRATTGSSDPLGSIGWAERTGGVLTARECVTLAGPLLRGELGILAGRLAMALRVHSGRRATIEPARLAPPDSSMARVAQAAAEDLLSP